MKSIYKNVTLIVILAFLSMKLAQANNKVGNGGDVIICKNSKTQKISSVVLLDFFENEKVSKKVTKGDEYTFAKVALDKLQTIAPKLHAMYIKRLNEIKNEIDFVKDFELVNIADSNHLVNPKNKSCQVIQVVIRKKEITKDEKRFLFDLEAWEHMDTKNRAGLLTHEIIYEHFAKLNETDSIKARKINSWLYTEKIITTNEFWNEIKDFRLPIYP